MKLEYRVVIALFPIAVFGSGCMRGNESTAPAPEAHSAPVEPQRYVLDFTDAAAPGTPVGNFVNLAFNIDLREPVRKFSLPNWRGGAAPGILKTYDFADCENPPTALEKQLDTLPPGQSALVGSLDIELTVQEAANPPWTGEDVCFGYREPAGRWHWDQRRVTFTQDAATQRWHALLDVTRDADAIKLVFGYGVPKLPLSRITYTASPKAK
jgi:hypothetical protein